ncbi:MAG TPA: hypothetical protein PKO06_12920 [Candidatus Ozemobacteraceae bacterium]|nr:hypothetical protein [Candidatus Ozemobacteraceae bacterium]
MAISVASLVMLPIILLFGVTEKVTYKSINEVVASNLALQKIEELKSRPFEKLREIIETQSPDPIDGPFAVVKLPREFNDQWNTPGVEYSREAALSFYPYPNPDATAVDYELQKRRIRIRIAVDFTELVLDKKRVKTFEMSTIVTDETLGSGLNASFTNPVPNSGGN